MWKWRDPRIVGGVILEQAFRLDEGSFARTRTIGLQTHARGASSSLWYPRPPRLALPPTTDRSLATRSIQRHGYTAISAGGGGGGERNSHINATQHWVRLSCFVFVFRFFFPYQSTTQKKHTFLHSSSPDAQTISDDREWFQKPKLRTPTTTTPAPPNKIHPPPYIMEFHKTVP